MEAPDELVVEDSRVVAEQPGAIRLPLLEEESWRGWRGPPFQCRIR